MLEELLKELPLAEEESNGLIITVETSFMVAKERIPNDDEDGFASMKEFVNRQIRKWFAEKQRLSGETPTEILMDIFIERMARQKILI